MPRLIVLDALGGASNQMRAPNSRPIWGTALLSLMMRLAAVLLCIGLSFASLLDQANARNLQPYGSQPLVRLAANRPGINVFINGQGPFLFLVDTATSHTVLTPHLRDRLALVPLPGPPTDVVTAASSARSQYYNLAETAGAGVIVEGIKAVVLPLPEQLGIMGALGADFLSNFVVDLDFRAQRITLYPEGAQLNAPTLRRVRGTLNAHGFIVVPSLVEGIPTAALFDSGASFTVGNGSLASTAKRYGIPTIRVIENTLVDAVRQRDFAQAYTFDKIGIGPAKWWSPRVLIAGMRVFDQIGLQRKPAIFVGMDLMAGRRVVMDFGEATLWLEP